MKLRQNVITQSSLTACSDKCEDALNPEAQIQSQEGYTMGMPKQLARNRAKRKVKNSTVEVAGGLEYPESKIILFLEWKDDIQLVKQI